MQSNSAESDDSVTKLCRWCEGSGTMYDTHCAHMTGGCPCDAYEMPCADCNGTGVLMDACEYEIAKAKELKARLEKLARRAVGV